MPNSSTPRGLFRQNWSPPTVSDLQAWLLEIGNGDTGQPAFLGNFQNHPVPPSPAAVRESIHGHATVDSSSRIVVTMSWSVFKIGPGQRLPGLVSDRGGLLNRRQGAGLIRLGTLAYPGMRSRLQWLPVRPEPVIGS